MPLDTWLAFVAASTVLLLIPGPTILTVVSYSVTYGAKVRLPLVLAVALGDSTALFASLVGLGALVSASAVWFTVIKMVGGIYLLYLGGSMLLSKVHQSRAVTADSFESSWKLFVNTYVVTALNPKGLVFFVAFLPQFVSPEKPIVQQLFLLALTFVVLATINAAAYALFASTGRNLLGSLVAQRLSKWFGGSILCVAGAWTLLARPVSNS